MKEILSNIINLENFNGNDKNRIYRDIENSILKRVIFELLNKIEKKDLREFNEILLSSGKDDINMFFEKKIKNYDKFFEKVIFNYIVELGLLVQVDN